MMMMGMMSKIHAAAVLGLMLLTAGCNPNTLQTVLKAEAGITAGCSTAFTVVAAGATQGTISTADATAIMQVLLQVEQANRQAITATTTINALNATNAASLLTILTPVNTALSNAISTGLVGIKDPATQQNVKLALTTIQTLIVSIDAVLKAVK
jgi:hypothetical protein